MSKLTKRMHLIYGKIHQHQSYNLLEAINLLKMCTLSTFIESIDIAVQVNSIAHKNNQNIYNTVILPYGNGRKVRIAVFTQGLNLAIAKTAGADITDVNTLLHQIKNNKFNFDIIIASPDMMSVVNEVNFILAPRKLMPTPKLGTVTTRLAEVIKNCKTSKQIFYKNDKNGIIHTSIGRINFDTFKLGENVKVLLSSIKKQQLIQVNKICFKKITLSTTMGAGLTINLSSIL